jgi:hypothetical protein
LLKKRLKGLILGDPPAQDSPPRESGPADGLGPDHERHSHGLEQFSSHLMEPGELCILDLGGITQANVSFVTGLGHKLFAEDFLTAIDRQSGEESNPLLAELFLRENLSFPEARFDGVLLWDALEFLPPPVLKAAVERLFKITKPGAYLLAFFHSDEKAALVPSYSYRITSAQTLNLTYRSMRRPLQLFNNRGVERLFQHFHSVKFFLTRDNLREVIVRR